MPDICNGMRVYTSPSDWRRYAVFPTIVHLLEYRIPLREMDYRCNCRMGILIAEHLI